MNNRKGSILNPMETCLENENKDQNKIPIVKVCQENMPMK